MWLSTSYLTTAVLTPTPTISGTATAGQILTAKTGTWSPKPASYSYQWKRGGTNVSGATGSTYRVTNDDAGKSLTVTVTAKFTGAASVSKTSAAVTATGIKTTRIAGDDRYATSVAVSIASYPEGAQKVYLVSGLDFADALAAAPLAAAEGAAPPPGRKRRARGRHCQRAQATRTYERRPRRCTAALDAKTESRVKTVLGSKVKVERVGGDTRYETSRLLAARGGNASTVFVATGRGYADALGAAAIAGQTDAPVILVDGAKSSVDAATLTLMKKLKASKVVIVGGTVSVPKGVESQLAAAGLTTARYGGATRYDTNVLLNSAFFPTGAAQAVLASGENFPDALTGSVLAGRSAGLSSSRRAPAWWRQQATICLPLASQLSR